MTPAGALRAWLRRRDGFMRNVAVLTGGTALGQLLVMATQPVLTRLYPPIDFGALQVYLSTMSIVSVAAALRYEYAIPLPEDDQTAANTLVLVLALISGTAVLCAIAAWWLAEPFTTWTRTPGLRPYLWLVPVGLLGGGFYNAISYWTVRKKWFRHIAQTKVQQSAWQAVIQTALGALRVGPAGLIVGDVIGRAAGGGTLARVTLREGRATFQRVSLRGMREAAARYRRFPLYTGVSALFYGGGTQLPPLLISAFYGGHVLGWFSLGQRLLVAPLAFIGQATSQVYLGEAPPLARTDRAALRRLYLTTAKRLALFCAPPIAVLAVGGPWLFRIVFGTDWIQAGEYVQICSLGFAAQAIVAPLVQTLNVIERQDLQVLADFGYPAATIGSLIAAHLLGLAPSGALALFSTATFGTYAFLFVVALRAIGRGESDARAVAV